MQVLAPPSVGHLAHMRVAGARATALNAHVGVTARPNLFIRRNRRVIGVDGIRIAARSPPQLLRWTVVQRPCWLPQDRCH